MHTRTHTHTLSDDGMQPKWNGRRWSWSLMTWLGDDGDTPLSNKSLSNYCIFDIEYWLCIIFIHRSVHTSRWAACVNVLQIARRSPYLPKHPMQLPWRSSVFVRSCVRALFIPFRSMCPVHAIVIPRRWSQLANEYFSSTNGSTSKMQMHAREPLIA